MANLSVFDFEGYQVRFVGTAENPEWVAADITAVLGIDRTQIRRLESYQKGVYIAHTPGGKQEMATVTEAGLYALIFTSRKESAKRFQKWVFSEVLPSIRKTGGYGQPQPKRAITHYSDRCADIKKHLIKPAGTWCVIEHCPHLLLEVENLGYEVGEFDLLDGSVGRCWSIQRKKLGLTGTVLQAQYRVPQAPFPIEVNAYPYDELGRFREWLETEYESGKMTAYLQEKYGAIVKR